MSGINEFRQLEKDDRSVQNIFELIEHYLPSFKESEQFKNNLKSYRNEDSYSYALCEFLTYNSKNRYYFGREKQQIGSSKVDISVSWSGNLYLVFEAKVLPTPIGSSKERKEFEYVYGNGGGIERFKNLRHGLDNNKIPFNQSGMIAYLKENNFSHWHDRVNAWVENAKWDESEKLEKVYFGAIAKLKSTHLRKDNTNIELYHFWVYV